MAHIYPERLPEHVLADPKRGAERAVFEALCELPEPFTCFYSVAWLSYISDGGARDGEADFVVAHPDLGVLVLEVKGGAISFNATTGEWTSVNRAGQSFAIKDPAAQARSNKYALLQKLQELPKWPAEWLTIGHAVVFPDTVISNVSLRTDLPREIVLDGPNLKMIESSIRRVFTYFHHSESRTGALGTERQRILTDLLAKSFRLRTRLGVELDYEDSRLIELTEQQMRVLDLLSYQRRAAISGCAGSGKTMLAVEKARRMAEQGFEVLLTCFNAPLAEYLAERSPNGVDVYHFHGLCERMIRQAEINAIPPRDRDSYYQQFLPNLLLDAVEILGAQYDAIIVDEGQDFKENWWLALGELLRNPKNGIMYTFFDDNQNLYDGVHQIYTLIDSPPFALVDNCRNTQQIHRLVAKFHPQGAVLRALGPNGSVPEWIPYSTSNEMLQLLRILLHRLVNEEKIVPQDIVVLTPRAEARSSLVEGLSLGNFVLTRKPMRALSQIQVNTIHRFKGLERKVVIIAELDETARPDRNMILYVGCSRARVHLTLLHSSSFGVS